MAGNIEKVFIVDASFILSFLLSEDDNKVDRAIEQYRDKKIGLMSVSLLKFEVGNGIRTALLRKRINKSQAKNLYQAFLDLDIEEKIIDYTSVLNLALSRKLSYYDASYLYLARSKHLRLLTLDSKIK